MAPRGWMVRSFGLAFESTRVSIPATGSYCLATLMSSDRTKQICLWMTIYIYIYMLEYILVSMFTYVHIFLLFVDGKRWDEERVCEKGRVDEEEWEMDFYNQNDFFFF